MSPLNIIQMQEFMWKEEIPFFHHPLFCYILQVQDNNPLLVLSCIKWCFLDLDGFEQLVDILQIPLAGCYSPERGLQYFDLYTWIWTADDNKDPYGDWHDEYVFDTSYQDNFLCLRLLDK